MGPHNYFPPLNQSTQQNLIFDLMMELEEKSEAHQLLQITVWGKLMSFPHFMPIHQIVEIFWC